MWVYQAVTNVGVQVLVLMGLGYLFARFKFLEQAKFLPQSNFIVLMLALPAFNLYLMGIKLDLQNPEPWKSLAAFLLWVFVTQACILTYTWRFCGGDAGEAAVINMVLLMDNYAITGLLALNATIGTKWGTLALLMAMGFFLVIFPFSLAAFEWEKWAVQEHVEAVAEAAVMDIEAATAAAAAVEAAEVDGGASSRGDSDVKPSQPPPDASGPGALSPLLRTSPLVLDAEQPGAARQPPLLPPSGSYGPAVAGASGVVRGGVRDDLAGVELSLHPGMKEPPASGPPSAGPKATPIAVATTAAVKAAREGGPLAPAATPGEAANGFPHESRYCWWSNEDYVPARPLLLGVEGGATTSSTAQPPIPQRPATVAAFMPQQQSTSQRRHTRQELLQRQLKGSYVPPPLTPTAAVAVPSVDATSHAPLVSPFQASALLEWPNGAPDAQGLPGPQVINGGGGGYPGTAPPSAGLRLPATGGSLPSGAVTPRGRSGGAAGLVERRGGSILPSVFEQLAAAGSGQLPTALFGELGDGPSTVASLPEPKKPRLQDLEFALTHQISGGTACQLARISRGYTAAAAAATAAAASPDANIRRMLLTSGGRGPQQLPSSLPTSRMAQEALGPVTASTATNTVMVAPLPPATTGTWPPKAPTGMPIPGWPERRSHTVLQPPPSPSTGTGVGAGSACAAGGSGGGGGSTGTSPPVLLPPALVSLESGDSTGPSGGALLGFPESVEEENEGATEPKVEASATSLAAPVAPAAATPGAVAGELACPTLSGQAAVSATAGLPSAPSSPRLLQPAAPTVTLSAGERLTSTSMPIFSFGRRSARRLATTATGGTGAGTRGEGGSGVEWTPRHRTGVVQRSVSDTAQADRMLLKLASGLALDGMKRRTRTGQLLVDTDPNVLLQLADAAAVSGLGPEGFTDRDRDWDRAVDRQLVREATKEALRRHGGLAGAFAAFVSGHPQLWHIVSTLVRNPMIWTMFIAMVVSVSGLRVFLDPASPRYRPEVGWVAGSLSWINGLVVPMSIFSNGAWMYGKPVLPKGEVIKMVVLLLIKVGILPLLMAGCALLVQLDGMHVAAMTVLTLSPAAAASFVLAVQYGRGVELVSLTNIIGNVFLTPLLIMWLKIMAALKVDFHLHDDT